MILNYEYRCEHCNYSFESSLRAESQACHNCKKKAKRIYTAPAIHFKGGGFSKEIRG